VEIEACEETGCYQVNVTYQDASMSQMRTLIEISEKCQQHIRSALKHYCLVMATGWTGRREDVGLSEDNHGELRRKQELYPSRKRDTVIHETHSPAIRLLFCLEGGRAVPVQTLSHMKTNVASTIVHFRLRRLLWFFFRKLEVADHSKFEAERVFKHAIISMQIVSPHFIKKILSEGKMSLMVAGNIMELSPKKNVGTSPSSCKEDVLCIGGRNHKRRYRRTQRRRSLGYNGENHDEQEHTVLRGTKHSVAGDASAS
jgi:hypothetical protein